MLGATLGALGQNAEAERLLLEGHRKMLAQPDLDPRWTRQSAERLAVFYQAQGRHGEAARYR